MNPEIEKTIYDLVDHLPKVECIKAYGSSVGYQKGYENMKKQIDLIIAVENIKKFYEENLISNGYMYSFLSKMYFKLSSREGLKWNGPICYTSHIPFENQLFKIGIIEKSDVIEDLLYWKTFFLAGRFQKEMLTIKEDKEIELANEINKKNALTIALVFSLNQSNQLLDLYKSICSLSYIGDRRLVLKAEDPHKTENLANGSKKYFHKEYRDKTNLFSVSNSEEISIHYDLLITSILNLPDSIKERILLGVDMPIDIEDLYTISTMKENIYNFLYEKNSKISLEQIIKGFVTAGPKHSMEYSIAKLKKGRK